MEAAPPPPPAPAASSLEGRRRLFPAVSDAQWNDWRWQLRQRVTSLTALQRLLPLDPQLAAACAPVLRIFPMAITPYYLALIDPADPEDPLRRQVVPAPEELLDPPGGSAADPLAEEEFSPLPGLTHRYPDRALMLIASTCAAYCRHCMRKRILRRGNPPHWDLERMLDYLAGTPQVREVLLSGGDPLTLGTARLERILRRLRAIPHLEVIRLGSRVPVTLPQRIDEPLCRMLERYHPLWINLHFNHPRECTPEAALACERLLRAGIPLNNQTVLLRGVNDQLELMRALCQGLLRLRVRPYYLFQCDPVYGTAHLRTTVAAGQALMAGLRGYLSGLGVPLYALDAPGGGGKVPGERSYILSYDEAAGEVVFRNYRGEIYRYQDPPAPASLLKEGS